MVKTACVICGDNERYRVVYEQNFEPSSIDECSFSPKAIRRYLHYRIVKCSVCGAVYSNPILEEKKIAELYLRSKFTYQSETKNLIQGYFPYFNIAEKFIPGKRLLEIGCSNGFFLKETFKRGYEISGVEPSIQAVQNADHEIRDRIKVGLFDPRNYQEKYFDIVCFFQVLDPISDPNEFLKGVNNCLKNNGIVLAATHNITSFSSRILGEKCPIIDFNHIYYFDKKTLRLIFEKHGFEVKNIFDIRNIYSFSYWIEMLPLPIPLKNSILTIFKKLNLSNKTLKIKAGNIGIIAKRL